MAIPIQWLLLDVLTGLWITGFSLLLLLGLPHKILVQIDDRTWADRAIECFTKSTLLLITGGLLLAKLALLNWFTIVVWYVVGLLCFQFIHHRQEAFERVRDFYHRSLFFLFDLLDQQVSERSVYKALQAQFIPLPAPDDPPDRKSGIRWSLPILLTITVIGSFALLLRYEHVLPELRLSRPDLYPVLLATRQILAGDVLNTTTPVAAAFAAGFTLLSAADPMQVVRFLPPLLGVALVMVVGYGMYSLLRNGAAALVAMFSLATYWFTYPGHLPEDLPTWLSQYLSTLIYHFNTGLIRQWTGSELELGALFLVLTLTQLSQGMYQKQRSAWIVAGCGSAIVALAVPQFLFLVVLGSLGLVISRRGTLGLVALVWLSLGLLSPMLHHSQLLQPFLLTLPVALSLLCGYLFALLSYLPRLLWGNVASAIGLMLVFALSINFLLPLSPEITYLEYDIAAREMLALNARFPAKQWMVVAPAEQLSQTYGDAWYSDLAEFVDTYSDRVQLAHFQFPFSVPDLLVFVEKRPFKTFETEPSTVAGEAAFDPVYRNYRTLAGRSSLQFEAMKLCETYLQHHPDSTIEYEDQVLKVYHFHLPEQAADRLTD